MKKKTLLLALFSGAAITAQAQSSLTAGTISLGGNLGFSRTEEEQNLNFNGTAMGYKSINTQFRVAPRVGYFVADNLALGLHLDYSSARRKIDNIRFGESGLDPSTSLRIGPYVQYYKMLTEQFGLLGTLDAGFQRTFTPTFVNGLNNITNQRTTGFYAGITPGVIYFPVPKFGISAAIGGLGYSWESIRPTGADTHTRSSFGADFGLSQLQLGGTFYFGR